MNRKHILLPLALLFVLISCREEDTPLPTDTWSITMDNNVIECYERYYSLYTMQSGDIDTTLTLSTTAEWLTLMTGTLPNDGILQIRAEANALAKGRTADIVVTSTTNPSRTALLTIYQRGLGDYNENNADSDPLKDYRVGWGFNAFGEYKSLTSLRGKIIDPARLAAFDSDTTFHSLQEVVRAREEFNIYTSRSLQEMSSILTKTMTSETSFLGVKKTINRYSQICTKDVREQACAYARLQKTIATRSIDSGALIYIAELNDGIKTDRLPFTDEFRKKYDAITKSTSSSQMDKLIQEMIDAYGTHLVVEASVGCMLDLVLTFEKQSSYDFESTAESVCKNIFGRSSSNQSSSTSEHTTCNINNNNAFQIKGGSSESKQRLQDAISKMTTASQLSPEVIMNWMSGVSTASLQSANERRNLEVVDFRFIPIWKLFADKNIQIRIQNYVVKMSERSDCAFSEYELGTDNYCIDLTSDRMKTFRNTTDETLVRVVRTEGGIPILEIANEYVPKIRSDRRITVYYPILNGRTRIGQGLFPGDGEGNPPAMLTFSDGDVYVNPIDGYGNQDVIKRIYYIHGSLYDSNYGVVKDTPAKVEIKDEWFVVWEKQFPIVKIGSGYWTRKNVNESLEFGEPFDSDEEYYYILEEVFDDVLYANIFYGNSYAFRFNNPGLFDAEEDPIVKGKRIHWYLPKVEDIRYMETYIGNNCKSLFQGQVSGFDAEFVGYYGDHDDMHYGNYLESYDVRYKDEYCFIASKDSEKSGEALVLSPQYTLSRVSINKATENLYPVRPFRTSYYTYPNIK